MKPTIRVGQEWSKAHNDGPSSPPTRIRVMDVRHLGQHLTVATVTPDGRLIRKRDLLGAALTNTPSGYMLAKDAPPEAKAGEPHKCDNCLGIHPESCMFRAPDTMATALRQMEAAEPTPSAPSPLEVVRVDVEAWLERLEAERPASIRNLRTALATLEESIRADVAEKACEAVHKAMMLGRNRWAVADAVDRAIISRKG